MNKKGKIKNLSTILLVLCIAYIVLIKMIDVRPIGPAGSSVGLATINEYFHTLFPWNEGWYEATKYLGFLPFLWVAYYGICGLIQLIKTKSFKKIDKKLLLLGGFYVLVGMTYLLFEKVIINYRPVLMDGELEASFPSSHTMLAICVCVSALWMNESYIKNEKLRTILDMFTLVLMIVLVMGRIFSGVHWITDIIGGILISLSLIRLFYEFLEKIKAKSESPKEESEMNVI